MLTLNLKKVADLRGISNLFSFLRKLDISYNVAGRYSSGNTLSISFRHLESLCTALNCTPNDIIDWTPSNNITDPENHPLHSLSKNNQSEKFKNLLQTLPLEKLNEIARIVSENKKEAQG